MKKIFTTLLILAATGIGTRAQNNVGINNTSPVASAALMVDTAATGPQGILVPRMAQARRDAIITPATGLMVYQTDNIPGFYYYNGTAWNSVGGNGGAALQLFATSTMSQTKSVYAYGRNTFYYDTKVGGVSQTAFTNNNAYTVPTGMGGLYNINLAIILSAYQNYATFSVYPEIQVTRGATLTYYYGTASPFSTQLSGDVTDPTSLVNNASQAPTSYSRGVLNITLPLQAGDIIKVFYRGNSSATASNNTVSFSTDGSTYLSIVKLN